MCYFCFEFNFGLLNSTLILIVTLTFSFVYYDDSFYVSFWSNLTSGNNNIRNINVVIGITSAPDHIQQRQSLRETWTQLLPTAYTYKFLIGEQLCDIHPSDRSSQYSCELLDISIPENTTKETMFFTSSVQSLPITEEPLHSVSWFSFHVNYPIVVHLLGIGMNVLPSVDSAMIRVTLYEQTTSAKMYSVTFNSDSLKKTENNLKKLNDPMLLPQGFEGNIKVDGLVQNGCRSSSEWSHHNLITINNMESNILSDTRSKCILPILGFTIKDVEKLEHQLNGRQNRTSEWATYNEGLRKQIQDEMERYKDIMRPGIVDVYRNLPKKVLRFLKWAHINYKPKYVLKTDDDTFIDVLKVKEELDTEAGWDWWSCFRVGWPVQRQGKWRERETSVSREVYPPFPSGAGYVLSQRALEWLVSRADNLSTAYQGEDVSVGIWLEELQPTQHVGRACHWACDDVCHSTESSSPCNKMQLSVEEVYDTWTTHQLYGNICYTND